MTLNAALGFLWLNYKSFKTVTLLKTVSHSGMGSSSCKKSAIEAVTAGARVRFIFVFFHLLGSKITEYREIYSW
jgi:hypothetical protein